MTSYEGGRTDAPYRSGSFMLLMNSKFQRPVAYVVFFFSGLCGLGCQMIWSRRFGIGLGHELPAVLAVVAAFFGGITLGAWSLDGWIGRSAQPGRWYATLELVIAFWGLALVALLPVANELALRLIGLSPSPPRHWLVGFSIPFVVLLPATLSMGATLPAMERFISPLVAGGKCIGLLYALNTLGAVAGTLLSTLVLVPALGFARAMVVLAGLNALCGVAVLLLPARANREDPAKPQRQAAARRHQRLDVTLFVTGLLGIGYEVLGVRVMAEVLENTIYSFAASLSVYLLGAAVGAGIYHRFLRQIPTAKLMPSLLLGLCTGCLLGAWTLAKAQGIYDRCRGTFGGGLAGGFAAEAVVAGIIFGIPTLLMGATFSHVTQSSRREREGVGRAVALNTLGSALAPLVFGVILLPALGAKWSLVCLSITYLTLLPTLSRREWVAALLPLALVVSLPQRLQFVQAPPGGKILEYLEGMMDSVAVVEHFDGHRSLLVNNRFTMGGTGAADAAKRHAHLPLLLHPSPKRALFLGLGTAISFAAAGPHRDLSADGVELIPEIPAVLRYFEPHNRLRPGLSVQVADARRFVRASTEPYDVIVADLFHPSRDGAGALYTREHFQAIHERLAPGGIFCQWLPLYQLDEAMLRVIVATCLDVFPRTRAFLLRFNVDTPVLGLIAADESSRYSPDWIEKRARDPELTKELKALGLPDTLHLLGCFIAGPNALRSFSKAAELNTDDRPVVIFRAPHFAYGPKETPYRFLLSSLARLESDPTELLERSPDGAAQPLRDRLRQFIQARDLYLRGLVEEAEGRFPSALDAYVASARASDNFSTSYARCLTIAVQQAKTKPEEARRLLQRLAEAQPSRPVANELLKRLFTP